MSVAQGQKQKWAIYREVKAAHKKWTGEQIQAETTRLYGERFGFAKQNTPRVNSYQPPQLVENTGVISYADLLKDPGKPLEWLVDGVLSTAGVSLLSGMPKAGKSTLARTLAASIVKGKPWLDFKTRKGSVLYFALEDHRHRFQESFDKLGITKSDPFFVGFGEKDEQSSVADQFYTEVMKRKPKLAILDTLGRCHDVGGSYHNVLHIVGDYLKMARETNTQIVLVHHLGKNGKVMGSTGLTATVDTLLDVTVEHDKATGENVRIFSGKGRYSEEIEPTRIEIEPVSGAVKRAVG